MTLKRLLIVVAVLVALAGGGMIWLARVAYTPQGRARIIIAQLKGDTTSLHGWLLNHHLVRPGYSVPPNDEPSVEQQGFTPKDIEYAAEVQRQHMRIFDRKIDTATSELVSLGREVLPIVIEALQDDNGGVQMMAIRACGKFRDPAAIEPLAKCMRDVARDYGASKTTAYIHSQCMNSLDDIVPQACGPLMDSSKNGLIPAVRNLLNGPDPVVSAWAADALEKLGAKLPSASQPGKP